MNSLIRVERSGRHPSTNVDLVWISAKVPEWKEPRRRVAVFAGGRCCGPAIAGGLLKGVATRAANAGRPLTIVTCNEPCVGKGAYAAGHRAEFIERTLAQVVARSQEPPVLIGHSWNAAIAVRMAAAGQKEGKMNGLVCYTGLGLRAQPPDVYQALADEAAYALRFLVQPGTYAPNAVLAVRSLGHWLGNPCGSTAAIREACGDNIIDEFVAFSKDATAGAAFARYDTLAGDGSDLAAAGFVGELSVADTSHLGAVVERSKAASLSSAVSHVAFSGALPLP